MFKLFYKLRFCHYKEKQKQQYDAKHARVNIFQIGTEVLKKRKGGNLDPKWAGPYIITAKHSKGFYSLKSTENPFHFIKRVNGTHLKVFN